MALFWVPPEGDYVKINVHCVSQEHRNRIGNKNGVGALIRDPQGTVLWGAMGPFNDASDEKAILWGIQSAVVECFKRDKKKIHFETDNHEVFIIIRYQDEIQIAEELEEVMGLFNTVYFNNFVEGKSSRIVSRIPVEQNRTTQYMAEYGMENLISFAEISGMFGNLQYFLDRDMGLAFPYGLVENLDLGEVVDASPPRLLSHPREVLVTADPLEEAVFLSQSFPNQGTMDENPAMRIEAANSILLGDPRHCVQDVPGTVHVAPLHDKGKGKLYSNMAFNDNGILSLAAVEILDSGALACVSSVFAKEIIDMDQEIWVGVFAKDVLDSAVLGWLAKEKELASLQAMVEDGRKVEDLPVDAEMMDVAKLIVEWSKFEKSF